MESLDTCSDPSKFATLKAEPDWRTLGKRLGKNVASVAKAIQQLTTDQIQQLENSGSIDIVGHQVFVEDVKVICLFSQHSYSGKRTRCNFYTSRFA